MKKTILISVKPKYAQKILDGTKRVEYRRRIFKEDVGTLLIYESTTTRRVVGEVPVKGILCDTVSAVWDKTKDIGGITAKEYYAYFDHKSTAYAIFLGKPIRYEKARTLGDFGITHAPLSFCYVTEKIENEYIKDRSGQTFGHIQILKELGKGKILGKCLLCGKVREFNRYNVVHGLTKSCGCALHAKKKSL